MYSRHEREFHWSKEETWHMGFKMPTITQWWTYEGKTKMQSLGGTWLSYWLHVRDDKKAKSGIEIPRPGEKESQNIRKLNKIEKQ